LELTLDKLSNKCYIFFDILLKIVKNKIKYILANTLFYIKYIIHTILTNIKSEIYMSIDQGDLKPPRKPEDFNRNVVFTERDREITRSNRRGNGSRRNASSNNMPTEGRIRRNRRSNALPVIDTSPIVSVNDRRLRSLSPSDAQVAQALLGFINESNSQGNTSTEPVSQGNTQVSRSRRGTSSNTPRVRSSITRATRAQIMPSSPLFTPYSPQPGPSTELVSQGNTQVVGPSQNSNKYAKPAIGPVDLYEWPTRSCIVPYKPATYVESTNLQELAKIRDQAIRQAEANKRIFTGFEATVDFASNTKKDLEILYRQPWNDMDDYFRVLNEIRMIQFLNLVPQNVENTEPFVFIPNDSESVLPVLFIPCVDELGCSYNPFKNFSVGGLTPLNSPYLFAPSTMRRSQLYTFLNEFIEEYSIHRKNNSRVLYNMQDVLWAIKKYYGDAARDAIVCELSKMLISDSL
jgi:hypothetical protein